MKLSSKMFVALSEFWFHKFQTMPDSCIDVEELLSLPESSDLSDTQNMLVIIHNVRKLMKEYMVGEYALSAHTRYGFAPIAYYFAQHSDNNYDIILLDELVSEVYNSYKRGEFSITMYLSLYKSATLIKHYHCNGTLTEKDFAKDGILKYPLSASFDTLLEDYILQIGKFHSLSLGTLNNYRSSIRAFLYNMEQHGVFTTREFAHQSISKCISTLSINYSTSTCY